MEWWGGERVRIGWRMAVLNVVIRVCSVCKKNGCYSLKTLSNCRPRYSYYQNVSAAYDHHHHYDDMDYSQDATPAW